MRKHSHRKPKTPQQQRRVKSSRANPRTARDVAFCVLDDYQRSGEFAAKLLENHRLRLTNAEADNRLAMELCYGVIRRQATLNTIIEPHVSRPRQKTEGALWTLLQLGAYQLIFMDSIPRHAAVNETVAVAKRFGNRGWSGFVNGVLRSISREVSDDPANEAAADSVPLSQGRFRKMTQPVFPDPQTDPVSYFSRAFSFPRWLSERWSRRFSFQELQRLGFWFNLPAKFALRVNRLRTTVEELVAAFETAGIDVKIGNRSHSVLVQKTSAVPKLPGFAEGWFSVQDESAMNAAERLDPQPGETILDLCAAPGTKTTHLAELMKNQGRILACDIHSHRLARVEENARRLRIDIIETRVIPADLSDIPTGPFDAVLVDAPCSNSGVLGKRPEVRWRIRLEDVRELATLQSRLLAVAAKCVKPGGRLVYSTCSLEPEENSEVVQAFLAGQTGWTLIEQTEFIPGQPGDGGFQAALRKG